MLQGVAINLVAFARAHGNCTARCSTLFIITVAACRSRSRFRLDSHALSQPAFAGSTVWQDLREPGQEPTVRFRDSTDAGADSGGIAETDASRRRPARQTGRRAMFEPQTMLWLIPASRCSRPLAPLCRTEIPQRWSHLPRSSLCRVVRGAVMLLIGLRPRAAIRRASHQPVTLVCAIVCSK